jgi:hypothetical protein
VHQVPDLKRFTIVTGHYGCGKTNLAINLALDLRNAWPEVTLFDLDVVNPYFRSSDYSAMLESRGVRVISPTFAGTTLDSPSLPGAMYGMFDSSGAVIVDAGGDDVGATALGRFSAEVGREEHDLLYVINCYRNLTATPQEAAALLSEIEAACHLTATGVANNSHLRDETSTSTVLDSTDFASQTCELLGLPLVCTTIPRRLASEFSQVPSARNYVERAYPIEVYVRTPWEESPETDEEV